MIRQDILSADTDDIGENLKQKGVDVMRLVVGNNEEIGNNEQRIGRRDIISYAYH